MKNLKTSRIRTHVAVAVAVLSPWLELKAQINVSLHAPPAAPGEMTIASLTVDRAFGLAGADLTIGIPDFVSPGPVEKTSATSDFLVASSSSHGRLRVSMASAHGLADQTATLLRIPLRIAPNAPAGGFALALDEVRLFDEQPVRLPAEVQAGTGGVLPPPPDLDQDGLPDIWEAQYLGGTSGNPQTDSDGDGLSDYAEFVAGTIPSSSDSALRIVGTQSLNRGQLVTRIQWESQQGKAYEIQWSDGPVGPQMVWHRVYNPSIRKEGSALSWTDDGSRTRTPVTRAKERFYRVVLIP